MATGGTLQAADFAVFGLTLCVSLGIGFYYSLSGGRQKTTDEYLMGDRQMRPLPVCLSYTVSFISTVLILGFPAEIYTFGAEFVLGSIGIMLGNLLAVFIFVPVLYPLKFTSVNEYLALRFKCPIVKTIGSICTLVSLLLYSSNVYYGPSTAIEAVTGFPAWISIIIGSIVSICYTTIGGIKAVVWTDVFQSLIMLLGLISLVTQGLIKVGGFEAVFSISHEWGRMNFFNWDLDPHKRVTTWNVVTQQFLVFLSACGVGQASFQRYCSMPTRTQANWVVIGAIPGMILLSCLAYLTGWIAFAYFAQTGCDPLESGKLTNPNQIIPLFVMEVFDVPGFAGLFLAACTAGSLSTASSCLNAFSAIAWDDICKPYFTNIPKHRHATVAKLLALVAGIISTGIGFSFITVGGTVVQIGGTFSSASMGVFVSMFLLGVFVPWVNNKGVIISSVLAASFGVWVSIGSYSIKKHLDTLPTPIDSCPVFNSSATIFAPDLIDNELFTTPLYNSSISGALVEESTLPDWLHNLYSLSWMWILPCVCLIHIVSSIVFSLLTGGLSECRKVDPRTVHGFLRKYCATEDKSAIYFGESALAKEDAIPLKVIAPELDLEKV